MPLKLINKENKTIHINIHIAIDKQDKSTHNFCIEMLEHCEDKNG